METEPLLKLVEKLLFPLARVLRGDFVPDFAPDALQLALLEFRERVVRRQGDAFLGEEALFLVY